MSLLDDGSNASLITAAMLLFILGATITAAKAMRSFEPNADLPDTDDEALRLYEPWQAS